MRNMLALLALVGAVALAVWLVEDRAAPAQGEFFVVVEGPDGAIFAGNVSAVGTPYDVLVAAADAGGFEVKSTGAGGTLFVTHIAGYGNQGPGGWCFAIDTGAGWVYPQVGAAQVTLIDGDRVWWVYHDEGCPGA